MIYTFEKIINANSPGEIFTDNIDKMKQEYAILAKKWHPDFNDNSFESNKIMAKINILYEEGIKLLKLGKWIKPNLIRFTSLDKKVHEINYCISHDFELGIMYIGKNVVTYIIENIYKDLFQNAEEIIKKFHFANDKMKIEMIKYLPKIITKFETNEKRLGIVIEKTPDLFLLHDVLNFYDGKIFDRQTAWILSSLYNIICYLDYIGISHNSILLDTYFISPKYHSGALLGGWWYARKQGIKMLGVPKEIYNILPPKIKENKNSDITTDLESVRLLGKQLLGESNYKIKYNKDIPKPFINWLLSGFSQNALDEYSKWKNVLIDSYGKRKFVDMNLSEDDLYKKIRKE